MTGQASDAEDRRWAPRKPVGALLIGRSWAARICWDATPSRCPPFIRPARLRLKGLLPARM